MPRIVLWSWELGPDLTPAKAREAYRSVLLGDPCAYCGRLAADLKWRVVDHIVARAAWGDDEWHNMTAACFRCNAAKRTDSVLGFLLGEGVGLKYGGGQFYPGELERARERQRLAVFYEGRLAA